MRKRILGFVFAAALLATLAVPLFSGGSTALANHSHFVVLPDGECAWIAGGGNVDPGNSNTGQEGAAASLVNPVANPHHPIHRLVHQGNPGVANDGKSAVDIDKAVNADARCSDDGVGGDPPVFKNAN